MRLRACAPATAILEPMSNTAKRDGKQVMCSLHASAPSLEEAPPPLSHSMLVDLYMEFCIQEGCKCNSAMIDYIKNNDILQQITLANNYVGPKGLRPVIRLLNMCQTAMHVDFDSNGADNTTVEFLCDALRNHIGVTTLNLRGNPISSTGGRRLLQLLETNPRIIHIDVRDTDIPEALQERISALVGQNFRRAQHHTPKLVEVSCAIKKDFSQGAVPLTEKNAVSLPMLPHRVWKAADVNFHKPKVTVEAAALSSTNERKNTPSVLPPPATKALPKMSVTLLRAVHQRFEERTRLYSEISQSQMCNRVAEVRAEVAAVERNSQLRPAESIKVAALSQPIFQKAAETDKNLGATTQAMDVGAEEQQRGENGTSGSSLPFQKQQEMDPIVKTDFIEIQKEDGAANERIRGNRPTEVATSEEKNAIEEAIPRLVASQHLKVTEVRNPNSGVLATNTAIGISTDESFQMLFDSGCDAYAQKDLEAAYVAWNDALDIAVQKNNREWVAVLSSNLQRLSYELAVEEGAGYLNSGSLSKATKSFQTALGIAKKAHNAAWEAEMKKALKHVQSAVFARCHEAANELFRQAQEDYEDSKHTNLKDIDDEESYYLNTSTGQKMRHSVYFLREWATVQLIRDAVKMWAEAYRAAQQVSGMDADSLKANVEKVLDRVAQFIFEQHVDIEEGETGLEASYPGWQRTSRYQHLERVMLAEVWFDILCYIDQGINHLFIKVVVSLQLSNLYMGTNQLQQAEKLLTSAVDGSKKLQHKLLEATALTYLATLYWLRASHSLAERILLAAIEHWENILATPFRGKDEPNALGSISIPTFSILMMQNACNSYLVCALAAMSRYREALEQLEHALIHKNSDLLTDKVLSAFCDHPSLDQIAAIASRAQTPFVYYFPARRLTYNTETNAFDTEENLFVWLVMPCAEMRFVDINITKNFDVSIDQAVHAARQGLLVEPMGQKHLEGYRNQETHYADASTGIITNLHRKAWIEPLQLLYEILIEPIYSHIMALDLASAGKDHPETVLTIIPSETLWCVPFHALLSKTEQFLVESIAVQLSFSATQVAFASLNAERVRQRDLHRNVAVVPLEIAADAREPSLMYPIDVERALEEGEVVMGVLKDAKLKHIRDASENKNHTGVKMVSTEIVVRNAESLRSALSCSCILHITAPISVTTPSPSDAVAARCGLTPRGGLYFPTDAGCVEIVTARELQQSEVFAELVTLTNANISLTSICSVQDDVLGVVRAFFSGGAPCVVSGQWCTPDMIPSMLFKKFYEVMTNNKNDRRIVVHKSRENVATMPTVPVHKAMHLAVAIRQLLKEDEFFRYNPRAWAGYYCFGHGYF